MISFRKISDTYSMCHDEDNRRDDKQVESGRPLETKFAFCRAVRVDNPTSHIFIAGNASTTDGAMYAPGDYYAQTKHSLGLIKGYVEQAGGLLENVVRTRVFVVDVQNHAEEVGPAHGGGVRGDQASMYTAGNGCAGAPGHGGGNRCGCGDLGVITLTRAFSHQDTFAGLTVLEHIGRSGSIICAYIPTSNSFCQRRVVSAESRTDSYARASSRERR